MTYSVELNKQIFWHSEIETLSILFSYHGYLFKDSFVVKEGEEEESNLEYSELELLEMKLEKQKRKKGSDNSKPVKRKRIIYSGESD